MYVCIYICIYIFIYLFIYLLQCRKRKDLSYINLEIISNFFYIVDNECSSTIHRDRHVASPPQQWLRKHATMSHYT